MQQLESQRGACVPGAQGPTPSRTSAKLSGGSGAGYPAAARGVGESLPIPHRGPGRKWLMAGGDSRGLSPPFCSGSPGRKGHMEQRSLSSLPLPTSLPPPHLAVLFLPLPLSGLLSCAHWERQEATLASPWESSEVGSSPSPCVRRPECLSPSCLPWLLCRWQKPGRRCFLSAAAPVSETML